MDGLIHLGLVLLDRPQVVALALENLFGNGALSMHGIPGDDFPGQGHLFQCLRRSYNLVFLGIHYFLSHHALALPVVHAQNMVAAFLLSNPSTPQCLAIYR